MAGANLAGMERGTVAKFAVEKKRFRRETLAMNSAAIRRYAQLGYRSSLRRCVYDILSGLTNIFDGLRKISRLFLINRVITSELVQMSFLPTFCMPI